MARVLAIRIRRAPSLRGPPPLAGDDELQRLPIGCLEWDAATHETLRALGLATIADLLRLPRDAFARRFGAARLEDLDRALGLRADPQPLYEPPAHFHAQLELPADFQRNRAADVPARRLLASLEGFLPVATPAQRSSGFRHA